MIFINWPLTYNTVSYGFSTALATKGFVKRIMNAQRNGDKYGGEDWQLEKAIGLLEERMKVGSYLSHTVRPVGTESGESNDILRSVLHCEQVVIDKIMMDDDFLDLFLEKLQPRVSKIVAIDFCIDTYNDMCPKCFSTCKHRKLDLLGRIVGRLNHLQHNVNKISIDSFRILISSHREYKVSGSEYITGKVLDNSLCKSESVFQFRNTGVEAALSRIKLIDQARGEKCAEIDKLFRQIADVGIKVSSSGSLIVGKKYAEQISSIKKALAGKKDKNSPQGEYDQSPRGVIKAENKYLQELRSYVNDILESIAYKVEELSALHYFSNL